METIAYAQCPVKNDPSFVVYEWNAWEGFLIALLVPEATILHAGIQSSTEPRFSTPFRRMLRISFFTWTARSPQDFPACRLQLIFYP